MPQAELFQQSAYDADNEFANTARLINCYREVVTQPGGKTQAMVKAVLGMEDYGTIPQVILQGAGVAGGVVYVVQGGRLWRIAGSGQAGDLAAVPLDPYTAVSSNNGVVTVTAGGRYFNWDGTTLTEPTPGAFAAFGSVDFLGNYTVLTERDGRRFQWSDPAQPATLNGLSFASAETNDAPLVRCFAIGSFLWLFKAQSYEIWGLSGGSGAAAFVRLEGASREVGLFDFNLIARVPNAAIFVGSDNRVHLAAGTDTQPLYHPGVETAIRTQGPQRCFSYEDEGHTIFCITFARGLTWCYDLATGEWHERAEGMQGWNVAATAKLGQDWLAMRDDGRVAVLRRVGADFGAPMVRTARTASFWPGRPFTLREIEFFGRVGIERERRTELLDIDGAPTPLNSTPPQAVLGVGGHDVAPALMVRLSRDGGHTFGPEKRLDMGARGEYMRRLVLRAQGQFRRPMVAEVRMSAPVEAPFYTAVNIEAV